jgi:phosphoglycerate dehydrogenase-like enzyme
VPLQGEVLVTWPDYDPDGPLTGRLLKQAGLTLRLEPKLGDRTPEQLAGVVGDAVAAIVSTDPFDARVFAAAPRLRAIARVGVGFDSIDVEAASRAGVAIVTTPGANEATVADHTIALLLGALRRVPEQDAAVRRGEWNRVGLHTAWLLAGATVGLVGFGAIGRLVARRLTGFDVRLLIHDPAYDGGDAVDLPTLLRSADVVSLHAPLLPDTHRLIGARELALMRPDSVLVNTARGAMVDEAALDVALRDGQIRAAALDVFECEPPARSPLLERSNIVLSPHIGGISTASVCEMTERATQSVLAVLRGVEPDGLVNRPLGRDGAAPAGAAVVQAAQER